MKIDISVLTHQDNLE